VQILVYVGAVAVLIVFTILLTHREDGSAHSINWSGIAVSVAVFYGLLWAILNSSSITGAVANTEPITVKQIGITLLTGYMWPLQCIGVLLTAALILVMEEKR